MTNLVPKKVAPIAALSSSNQYSMSRISEDKSHNTKMVTSTSNSNERMKRMLTIYNSKFMTNYFKGRLVFIFICCRNPGQKASKDRSEKA